MTVVAERTRVDVSLPVDVAVADLLPLLADMCRPSSPDGGPPEGGWCLARVGHAPLDASKTLAELGVLDGDLLRLQPRRSAPPPALFDDVIEAVAASTPAGFLHWTPGTALAAGCVAGGAGFLAAAAALYLAGPGFAVALTAAVLAALLLASGAVVGRVYHESHTAAVLGCSALPMVFVAGYWAIPGSAVRPHVVLGLVLFTALAVVGPGLVGSGVTPLTAAAAAGATGAGASLIAVQLAHPLPGIGAGAAVVALAAVSAAPRLAIHLAKLTLPTVPSTARELEQDGGDLPDYRAIARQAERGQQYLTGLILGFGVAAAVGAVLAARHGLFGLLFALTVAAVLMLRARTFANGFQALALIAVGAVIVGALLISWMVTANDAIRSSWVVAAAVLLGGIALLLGVALPRLRLSPPLRRSVEVCEAVLIAAVLPLALAVLDLYSTLRGL